MPEPKISDEKINVWAACVCDHGAGQHDAVVVKPICIDPGNRVLFEGTLGRCSGCECDLYVLSSPRRPGSSGVAVKP